MNITRGLIIKKEWIDKILKGEKVWELRSSKTKIRGVIGLIESGSGLVLGQANLYGCSDGEMLNNFTHYHQVRDNKKLDKYRFAWYLKDVKKYKEPIPYKHPQGAVIWVKLNQ